MQFSIFYQALVLVLLFLSKNYRPTLGLSQATKLCLASLVSLPVLLRRSSLLLAGSSFIPLIANIASWNFGVNSVIAYAAEDGTFPKSWSKRTKDGVPYVPSIWTCMVALIIAIGGIIAGQINEDISNLFLDFLLT